MAGVPPAPSARAEAPRQCFLHAFPARAIGHHPLPRGPSWRTHRLGHWRPRSALNFVAESLGPTPRIGAYTSKNPIFVDPDGSKLKKWVVDNGGSVHESLAVAFNAPSGSRGVVATAPIEEAGVKLVEVPESLYLTNVLLGTDRYQRLLKKSKAVVDHLPAYLQLALVLAIEAEAGTASFWAPYINCIRDQREPNGWAKSKEEVQYYLESQGLLGEIPDWEKKWQDAKDAIEAQVRVLREGWGRTLCIERKRFRWALGHVLSRCFGDDDVVGLAPFIDLMNHSSYAPAPEGMTCDDGSVVMYVPAVWDGEPRRMEAGEEVFISYVARTDPMTAYLSFGFVPEELLPKKIDTFPSLP